MKLKELKKVLALSVAVSMAVPGSVWAAAPGEKMSVEEYEAEGGYLPETPEEEPVPETPEEETVSETPVEEEPAPETPIEEEPAPETPVEEEQIGRANV